MPPSPDENTAPVNAPNGTLGAALLVSMKLTAAHTGLTPTTVDAHSPWVDVALAGPGPQPETNMPVLSGVNSADRLFAVVLLVMSSCASIKAASAAWEAIR